MENASRDIVKQEPEAFTEAYANWLIDRGELYKYASTEQNPPYELGVRQHQNFKNVLAAPVNQLSDIEDKIRVLIIDDAGDQLNQEAIDALNIIIRDLTELRYKK